MQSCVFQVCPKKKLNTQRFVAERLVIEGRVAESFVPESLAIGRVVTETLFDRSLIKRTLFLAQKIQGTHSQKTTRKGKRSAWAKSQLAKRMAVGRDANTDMWENVGKISCYLLKKSLGTSLKTRSALGTHDHAKFDGNFDNCGEPSHGFLFRTALLDWSPARQTLHWEQAKTSRNPLSCFRSNFSSYPISTPLYCVYATELYFSVFPTIVLYITIFFVSFYVALCYSTLLDNFFADCFGYSNLRCC